MNKIKWVISDLDGTLLRYENSIHIIEAEAIEAINKLIENKILFTIATGRKYTDAVGIYENHKLKDKCDYIIACNGAIIYNTKNQKIIKKVVMDKARLKIAETIFQSLNKIDFLIASYRVDGSIVFNKEAKKHSKLVNEFLVYEGDFSKKHHSFSDNYFKEKDLLKSIFFFENNQENKLKIFDLHNNLIKKRLVDSNELVITSPMSFELNPKGVSKGAALQDLSKILEIKLENALSIGDAENDISMFEKTKYSVTLESSDKKVKDKATYVLATKPSLVVADAINLLVINQ